MIISSALFILGIIIVGILAFLYGPKYVWKAWLSVRRNHYVIARDTPAQKRSSLITSKEVWAVLFAVIIIIIVFTTSQVLFGGSIIEPFSEFGVLGSQGKIGDYPRPGEPWNTGDFVTLDLYLGNQMGKPMYYVVMVKIVDNQTNVDPAPIESVQRLDKILMDNDSEIIPINVLLTEPGSDLRIIFELWTYNLSSTELEYHDRWLQLWIEVQSY